MSRVLVKVTDKNVTSEKFKLLVTINQQGTCNAIQNIRQLANGIRFT